MIKADALDYAIRGVHSQYGDDDLLHPIAYYSLQWSEILSDYNFVIKYHPGSQNAAANALSRRDKPEEGDGPLDKTAITLLPPVQFLNSIQALPLLPEAALIQNAICTLLPDDAHFGPIFAKIQESPDPEGPYAIQDGLLLHEGLVYVPARPELW